MMVNNFDIESYLISRGFERIKDDRQFYMHSPKMKVKLIYPNPAYRCGYQTMVITDPDRKFSKKEMEVPNSKMRADKIFVPLMSYKPTRDPSYSNVWETQGKIKNIRSIFHDDTEIRRLFYLEIHGASGLIETFVRPSLMDLTLGIEVNDVVHVVLKTDAISKRDHTFNVMEVIGMQKL